MVVIVLMFVILNLTVTKSRTEQNVTMFAGTVRSLESGVEKLEQQVERFDGENWQDIVPRVRAVSRELRGSLDELEREIRAADIEEQKRNESNRE